MAQQQRRGLPSLPGIGRRRSAPGGQSDQVRPQTAPVQAPAHDGHTSPDLRGSAVTVLRSDDPHQASAATGARSPRPGRPPAVVYNHGQVFDTKGEGVDLYNLEVGWAILIETATNVHQIVRTAYFAPLTSKIRNHRSVRGVVHTSSNEGAHRRSTAKTPWQTQVIQTIRVGEQFFYGSGGETGKVTKITIL